MGAWFGKNCIGASKFYRSDFGYFRAFAFKFHAKEFSMALQGMRDAPEIMAILVDESIMSINDENVLRSELMAFLSKHYERELKKINMQKDISFEEKAFLIRKLRSKISALRQGEFK